ncbi:MAG TPA: purine phosphorylase [Gammaproteobacteria bacterium]|nr:purine phosphorylase [Gammaproteobacteria bacterium]
MSFDEPVHRDGAFTIGFIAALALECTSLRRHSPRTERWLVVQSGPGAARAAAAASRAIEAGAQLLVSWGLAGGLGVGVAPGTVIAPRRVLAQGAEPLSVDPAWHSRLALLAADLGVHRGDLLTVAEPLESPAAKRAAAAATNAVAVDMESAGIAAAAAHARLPFVALRVVVDAVDDALPRGAADWVDEQGHRRKSAVLRAVVDARGWGALLTLARRYRVASGVLNRLAGALAAQPMLGAGGAALQAGS